LYNQMMGADGVGAKSSQTPQVNTQALGAKSEVPRGENSIRAIRPFDIGQGTCFFHMPYYSYDLFTDMFSVTRPPPATQARK